MCFETPKNTVFEQFILETYNVMALKLKWLYSSGNNCLMCFVIIYRSNSFEALLNHKNNYTTNGC